MVLYLVFNNQCWGIEWPFIVDATLGLAPKQKDNQHVDLVDPKIGFQGLAESLGVHAKTLKHSSKATETLRYARYGGDWSGSLKKIRVHRHLPQEVYGRAVILQLQV